MSAEAVLRAVIDTNVWISAFLTTLGAPAIVVRRILEVGQPVFSDATFAELATRLWLPKFDRYVSLEDRKALLHDAEAVAHWVEVPAALAARTFCRDAQDDKFIHSALACGAPWLVTGDRDLLAVPPQPGLQIVTPADALRLLQARR